MQKSMQRDDEVSQSGVASSYLVARASPLLLPAATEGLIDLYQGEEFVEAGLRQAEFGSRLLRRKAVRRKG